MNNVVEISEEDYKKIRNRIENPKTTMTDEKLKELKGKVLESLCLDRQKLVMRQPFTGSMLMRFELIPVRDYRIPTAMTDGSRIFFDIDFYKNLNEDERKFVLAHECWHNIYLHFVRKHNRDAATWNIATDCEINYMLRNERFTAPDGLCFPDKEDEGKNAEEIYEKLIKKSKKNKKQSGKGSQDGDMSGVSQMGNQPGDSSSSKSSKNSKGSGNKKLKGQFDKHMSKDGEASGGNPEDMELPKDEWGEKGEDPDYNPRIDSDAAEKIREGVISEAQKIERSQGRLPGGLENILNKLRKPEIPWQEVLSQFVTQCLGDKRQWIPPQRRSIWMGTYLQSRRGEKIQGICMVDTSGSTTADLPKFMSELTSLLKTFGRYELTLIQVDSEVQSIEKYDDCNEFPVEDCRKIKWKGFGGSDLRPAFKAVSKMGIEASFNLVFTDGYIDFPKYNPLDCPTLVVLTSDGNEDCCGKWAQKMKFKEKTDYTDYGD